MKYLYRLYCIVALPVLLLLTLLTALTTTVGCALGNANVWGYYPGMVWSRLTCVILLLRVRVSGYEHLESDKSYVFVANHQGAFDIFLIYGYIGRSFKWMMKKSLRKIPFVGKACESAGHIFVDRGNRRGMSDTLTQAAQTLQGGTSLVVFPEGSRSLTGEVGTFKRGAFQIAEELQLPVVPMTISGSFEVMPRNTRWIHYHPLTLTIHPPIPAGADDMAVVTEKARNAIIDSL